MKRVILTLFVISTLFSANLMNGQTWKVDAAHSSILFNAKHSGISFVNGRFEKFEATVEGGTAEDFTNAQVSFTAQVKSINTGVDGRDNHLRSADFLIWKTTQPLLSRVLLSLNQAMVCIKWWAI